MIVTSENEEFNSAEQEAEDILKAAFRAVEEENCHQGDECAVHNRVNGEYVDEYSRYARLITYLGDYVVVTDDNHELMGPLMMMKIMLGRTAVEDIPPRWETLVVYVGNGVLGDMMLMSQEERTAAIRYSAKHDEWDGLKDFHQVTVSALEAGLIDVSKPKGD